MSGDSSPEYAVEAVEYFQDDPGSSAEAASKKEENNIKNDALANAENVPAIEILDPAAALRLEEDKGHLEKRLSKEIWMTVTGMLKHDITEAFCNASLYLWYINRVDRTYFLFSKVGKILADKYHQHHREDLAYNQAKPDPPFNPTKCMLCFRMREARWFSGLLNLRLVCRDWCDTIDNYHQERYSPCSYQQTDHSDTVKLKTDFLETPLNCCELLSHFTNSHQYTTTGRSPFIGKSVFISLTADMVIIDGRLTSTRRHELCNVLRMFGSHIRYFTVIVSGIGLFPWTTLGKYKILREVMNLTPKIVELEVSFSLGENTEFEYSTLKRDIKSNSLPSYKFLKVIRSAHMTLAVLTELLRSNTQITTLILGRLRLGEDDPSKNKLHKVELQQLTELMIHFDLYRDFLKMAQLAVDWPLQKLTLSLGFEQVSPLSDFVRTVFNTISSNNRTNTLTSVDLTFPKHWTEASDTADSHLIPMNDCERLRLNLGRLTNFKIKMGAPMSLDFLLPSLQTLEYLEIEFYFEIANDLFLREALRNLERNSAVNFFSHFGRPMESNIWEVFPVLRQIVVCSRGNFRRKYLRDEV